MWREGESAKKSHGLKNIRIRVVGALVLTFVFES